MAMPITSGKLCIDLNEMDIGDYILWYYVRGINSTVGDFTQETTKGGVAFYFIKVDKGFLIADRQVFSASYKDLNEKNYILGKAGLNGELYRTLSPAEYKKYVAESDLNGTRLVDNLSLFNCCKNSMNAHIGENTARGNMGSYWLQTELTNKVVANTAENIYLPSGKLTYYNGKYGVFLLTSEGYHYVCGIFMFYTLVASYVGMELSNSAYRQIKTVYIKEDKKYINAGQIDVGASFYYRPALEYIDNSKSKTIWY